MKSCLANVIVKKEVKSQTLRINMMEGLMENKVEKSVDLNGNKRGWLWRSKSGSVTLSVARPLMITKCFNDFTHFLLSIGLTVV